VRRGRPPHPELLTPREQEVLAYLRDGLTNAEIAVRLRISPDGVKYHVSEILSKLGVSSRQEAAAWQPRRSWTAGLLAFLASRLRWVPFGTPGKIATGVALSTLVVIGGIFTADRLQSTGPSDANEPAAASSAFLGKLAYVVDGVVWVKELPNGRPVQVTRDGIYSYPRWSPSGEWLAVGDTVGTSLGDGRYIRTSLIVSADGSRQRYSQICGIWSPANDVLACMRSDNHLVLESPDGALVRDLDIPAIVRSKKDFAIGAVNCAAWSHDGSFIACNIYGPLVLQAGAPPGPEYRGIWVVRTDGTDAWEVFSNNPFVEGEFPIAFGFTPDGSQALFGLYPTGGSPGDVIRQLAVPAQGGQVTELEGAVLRVHIGAGPSADGVTIVSEGHGEQSWAGKRIAQIDLASGDLSYLTGPEATGLFPTWSPDFSQVAYVSAPAVGEIDGLKPLLSTSGSSDPSLVQVARSALAQRRIWVMDKDGANKRQLTVDSAYRDERPLWSADGSHIFFGRIEAEGNASIWILPATGGQPEKVADVSRCSKQHSFSGSVTRTGCVATNVQSYAAGPFWFGYYGYVAWGELISYWRGPG
jgi:DNA-binding CsgD family transcriptional regulator/Tol biopolymer transport system component